MNSCLRLVLFVFISFFVISCEKGKGGEEPEPTVPNRSVLIYMGGDNNLSIETNEKIIEIAKGWDTSFDGNLLIYQDTPSASRLIRIKGYKDKAPVYDLLQNYNKSNSADPVVFRQAINDAFKHYPATSYGLLVFSHASGWLPPGTIANPSYTPEAIRSIIIDGTDEMDIKDFAGALPDKLFSFIIFEACNMTNVEVAFELKDKTDYIVASSVPIVSPGFTYIYAKSIKYLYEDTANLDAFARSYFSLWNSYSGIRKSATVSLIKTEGLSHLADVVKSIRSTSSDEGVPMILQNYDGRLQSPFYFFDFGEYYSLLANDEQKQVLEESLNACIVYKDNTPNHATENGVFSIHSHSGLTTYIEQDNLEAVNAEYRKLKWYIAVGGNK